MDARVLVVRLLSLGWAAYIFWMSTDTFTSEMSRSLLARVLDLLHIHLAANVFSVIHTVTRKFAHISEYAVFSFLIYCSFSMQDRLSWQPQVARWAVAVAATYSLTDEFHQVFVRGRGPSLIDCGLDTMGAAMAMLMVYWTFRWVDARVGINTVQP